MNILTTNHLKIIRGVFLVLLALLTLREIYKSNLENEYMKNELKYRWHNNYELKKEILEDKVAVFSNNMEERFNKIVVSFDEKMKNEKKEKEDLENYQDSWFIRIFNSSLMMGLVLVAIYKTILNLIKG